MAQIGLSTVFGFGSDPRQIGAKLDSISVTDLSADTITDAGSGTVTITNTELNGTVSGTVLGAADGLATLDAGGTIPLVQIPAGVSGGNTRLSVRVKTEAALPAYTKAGTGIGATLTGSANGALPAVDGITLTTGDRILVDDDGTATGSDRGIYEVTDTGSGATPWILTRANDTDEDSELISGVNVFAEEGTVNGNEGFILTTPNPITVDVTSISFSKFTSTLPDYVLDISFAVNNTTTNTVYSTLGVFTYPGSNFARCPCILNVVARMDNGITSYDLRLQDITNNLTIASVTGNTNETDGIISTSSFMNVPATQAIWELQARRVGGGASNEVHVRSIQIR